MPLFRPDIVAPRDPAGFGLWLTGHAAEHKQFIASARALATPITIPDYDLLAWSDDPAIVRYWLAAHAQVHVAVDTVAGVSSIDFASVDLTNDEEFDVWLSDHAVSHADERAFFGLT